LFDEREYLLEHWLKADFALIKAWKGDSLGNLVCRNTARNFNPMMAAAARGTIAEVEHLVELGQPSPEEIVTPGIYVQRIFPGAGLREAHGEQDHAQESDFCLEN
jgi:3-oxoacid CoA-transferase subunit A